jgi:hypothetical protein
MKFYRLLLIIPLMILLGCNDYSLHNPFIARNGLYGFKDADGKIRIKPKYQEARSFNEDFASVKLNGKWGFIDKTGKVVIPPKYADVGYFRDGLAEVQLNGNWGLVNKQGEEVVRPKYSLIGDFNEGLAEVYIGFKFQGYIDEAGNEYSNMTEAEAREQMKKR